MEINNAEKLTFTRAVENMRDLQIACEEVRYLNSNLNEQRRAAESKVDLLLAQIRLKMQKKGN